MAAAAPKPEDRLAFADELAQVRAKDVKNKYKKKLNELEVEYQFILLRSLTYELNYQIGFTKSRRILQIQWGHFIIKPTFQTPTGIGTTSYANNATKQA